MPSRNLILALVAGCLMAGCLEQSVKTPEGPWDGWRPKFGLGIDASGQPAPGDFEEDPQDLERLHRWLNSTGRARLAFCGASNFKGYEENQQKSLYMLNAEAVISACMSDRDAYRKAESAHADGSAHDRVAELMLIAPQQMQAATRAIDAVAWPRNAVDAEILGQLMRQVIWTASVMRSASESANAYIATERQSAGVDALVNLQLIVDANAAVEWFTKYYPWDEQACQTDDAKVESIQALTWQRLNETVAKAERLRPPDEEIDLSSNYGVLIKDYRPGLEFATRHDWWPAMLWYLYLVEGSDSYWDHRYDPVLPTNEEASFLLMSYMNQSRTLISDQDNFVLQSQIYSWDFEEYPFWPALVMASSPEESPWTYGDLPCAPLETR